MLAAVSEDRLAAILTKLQSFETRHTLSSTTSQTRGIGAARQWIFDELTRTGSGRLQVSFDTYLVARQGERITRDVELRNVMAILPGKSPRRMYISAHYDSLARLVPDPSSAASPSSVAPAAARAGPASAGGTFDWVNTDNFAPGANDNGSGTALTMELARVFAASGYQFDATIVFILFAGEEQGLIGSAVHAQEAEAQRLPIEAVLNNDIVGNSHGGSGIDDAETVRVFSAGPEDSPSRQLARYVERQAARYVPAHRVVLVARHDRFRRGGDHTSFNEHGFTAVRITEANENYTRQHAVDDTTDGVSVPYLARNARVNAAALANLALAPSAPVVVNEKGLPLLDRLPSGYDANLQWVASEGAVGYRIVWRRAWQPDWEHDLRVGRVSDLVLPNVSIDDFIFGVAAVGPGGHESLVSAYVNPPRSSEPILTIK